MENQNTREYIDGIRTRILGNLSKLPARPGCTILSSSMNLVNIQMQDTNIQPDLSEGKDRGGIYLDDDKCEDDSRVIKALPNHLTQIYKQGKVQRTIQTKLKRSQQRNFQTDNI